MYSFVLNNPLSQGVVLADKFNLPSQILDAKTWKNRQKEGVYNPLAEKQVIIMSYHYAARLEEQLLVEPWNLVVIDEAHKLRNAHRASNRMGQVLADQAINILVTAALPWAVRVANDQYVTCYLLAYDIDKHACKQAKTGHTPQATKCLSLAVRNHQATLRRPPAGLRRYSLRSFRA